MGTMNDAVDQLDCTDQRLVFRLALAEVRRLRKAIHSMTAALSMANEDRVANAIAIADAVLDRKVKWNDTMPKEAA